MSALSERGKRPTRSSRSAGFKSSKVSPERAGSDLPPMKFWNSSAISHLPPLLERVVHRQGLLPLAVVVPVVLRPEELGVGGEAEPGQGAESLDPVLPGQLLALHPRTRVVVDRHLVDAVAESQHPGRDVGLDVEAGALQVEALPEVRTQHFVARLEVGDVAVEEHVAGQGDGLVADDEPEAESG